MRIQWESVCEQGSVSFGVWRARVPQGWLVAVGSKGNPAGVTFVPDVGGQWDGDALSSVEVQETLKTLEDGLGELKVEPLEGEGAPG